VRAAFIFAAWRKIAGEQVFSRTSPLLIEEKRLVIAVADKTWKRNLETLAGQLLFKLNALLGKPLVDFIEFRVSPSDIEPSAVESKQVEDEIAPPVELAVSARLIRNDELRGTVLKAAANCLSRPK
jgi:hypothetical protein